MVRVHFGPPLQIPYGGLAQLGERLPCKQEVTGSIPVLSTKRLIETPEKSDASLSLLKRKLKDAPWKLNIVIIDAIYEKATVKEKLLINFD